MSIENILGTIPLGWEYTTLGEVCRRGGGEIQTGPFGSQLHAADYVSDGIPSIMPANIGDNRVVETNIARITINDAERLSRYRVRAGDIVYSRRGDVERRALIRKMQDGWLCGTGCLRVRLGMHVADPSYTAFYLGHPFVREWIVRHAHGATMANLNTAILSACPFVLPPYPEQCAIASILSSLDDKIELNRRMNETLEAMARAIFQNEGISGGWTESLLGDICVIFDGPHATPKLSESGPIFLGISNLNNGLIDVTNTNHVSESDFSVWTRRVTPSPLDIVFSYETRLGQVAIIPKGLKCCLGRRMGLLRVKSGKIHPLVLLQAYMASDFQETIRQRTIHGSTVDRIPLKEMENFPIRVPTGPSMENLGQKLSALWDMIERNQQESRTLAQTRDLLLPKLMSGEIRIRDAETFVENAL
jgi:type I restriction enzyme, S subunit